MDMDTEKLLDDNSDDRTDIEMENIPHVNPDTSELPPPSDSMAYQITEPESYPTTTPPLMSELPTSGLGNSNAISQPMETIPYTTAAPVNSQPMSQTQSISRQYAKEAFSVCCYSLCLLIASLFCCLPLLLLVYKVTVHV